jgi:hypothetical protein
MPKGWIQAHSKPNHEVDFECECGHKFGSSHGSNGLAIIRKSYADGRRVNKYCQPCPECKNFCEVEVEDIPTAVGRKPTKRIVGNNQVYHIHGRDRNVYPSDLAEAIAESNERLRENGYVIDSEAEESTDGEDYSVAGEEASEK